MKPSAVKVARDWNESAMERESQMFRESLDRFWQSYREGDPYINYKWGDLIRVGQGLVLWLIETRSIPRGKAKAAEMAYRLFASARRSPRKMNSWVQRNQKNIAVFELSLAWPRKAEAGAGGNEVFSQDGFTVHNTLQLEGKDLADTKKAIERSVKAIKSSGLPNAAGIPYGNLFIVGRLQQPRTLAWYNTNADEVYLRPHIRVGGGELHNLTHELGHRYWFKLMQSGKKRLWSRYHSLVDYMKTNKPVMPKVGDPIPVPVRGHKTPPIIASDDGVRLLLETGGIIKKRSLWRILSQEANAAKFPTPYAATSASEHFAEAFAMYALDTLGEDHRKAFKAIVVDGEEYDPNADNAPVQTETAPEPTPEPVKLKVDPDAAIREKARESVGRMTRQPTDDMLQAWVDGFKHAENGKPYGDAPRGRMARYWQAGFYAQSWKDKNAPAPKPTPEPPAPKPDAPAPSTAPDAGPPDELPKGPGLLTMVKELESMARKRRTKKVLKFVEGVREILEQGKNLGPKREKRLTRLMQSYGLLADEGAKRVASRFSHRQVADRYLARSERRSL